MISQLLFQRHFCPLNKTSAVKPSKTSIKYASDANGNSHTVTQNKILDVKKKTCRIFITGKCTDQERAL